MIARVVIISYKIIVIVMIVMAAERLGQHQLDVNNSNDCQASSSTNSASQLAFNSSVQNAMQCDTSDEEDEDEDDITLANNSAGGGMDFFSSKIYTNNK